MQESIFYSLYKHRGLLFKLIQRDVAGRYRGSVMGGLWSLITPVLMLLIYLFVFGVVFNARRSGVEPGSGMADFGLWLFAGMLVHGLFGECLTRAPSAVVGQPSYVKKVIFPLEILPLVVVGSAFFHALVGIGVLLCGLCIVRGGISETVLWLPLVWLPLILLCAGVTWLVAALAVYLRDIGQMTGLVATVLLFLSPIFFSASSLPEHYRPLLKLNPLTVPIEMSRSILLDGMAPVWGVLGMHSLMGVVVAWLGLATFQKLRPGFADVL